MKSCIDNTNWFLNMQKTTVVFIVLVLCIGIFFSPVSANDYRYSVKLSGEFASLTGGENPKFPLQGAYGFGLSQALTERWKVDLSLLWYDMYDDTTASSILAFGHNKEIATRHWQASRLGVAVSRYIFGPDTWLNFSTGLGGGLMVWKYKDPGSDTTLKTIGTHNETIDFASSELFISGLLSIDIPLSKRWSLDFSTHADYLTGAGNEFADAVNAARDRWLVGTSLSLTFSFGSAGYQPSWPSQQDWGTKPSKREIPMASSQDSDFDGVPDNVDDCPGTPDGVVVDNTGCPVDSDWDGIPDGLDDCPGTDARAKNNVDIHGCPIDSDFDGVPDYLDSCPFNPVGAIVDENGCPVDSDVDGVPDGLDDCPGTLYGIAVDRCGCIDLSIFAKPMVLHIDYPPGSFEVDPKNLERLKELARVLQFVPEIRLEINGYTDNIGKERANRKLSEKRANRVRDYLVAFGVAKERMKVFGRGETNFVASNKTAAGRAKNRRIEIVFYK